MSSIQPQQQNLSMEQRELQLLQMQQLMESQIHRVTTACWPKCVTYTDNELSSKQSTCMSNCTDRFFDVATILTQRFGQRLGSS